MNLDEMRAGRTVRWLEEYRYASLYIGRKPFRAGREPNFNTVFNRYDGLEIANHAYIPLGPIVRVGMFSEATGELREHLLLIDGVILQRKQHKILSEAYMRHHYAEAGYAVQS